MAKKKLSDSALSKHLVNWVTLNKILVSLPEASVKRMLELEKKHRNRLHILRRLHQRYNKLRQDRELRKLLQ